MVGVVYFYSGVSYSATRHIKPHACVPTPAPVELTSKVVYKKELHVGFIAQMDNYS